MTQSREQPRHPLSHPDSASPSPSPSASFTSVAPRGFNPRPPPIEQPPAQARPLAHHHHHQQQQQQGGSTLYHSPPTPSSPPSSSSSSHPISSAQQRPQIIPFKRSQRPSWSCTECARRKIKCNKQVPCDPCLKRGRGDSCTLAHDEFLIATPAQLKKLEVGGSSPSKQPQTARKEAGVETGVQPETNLDPTLPQNQSPGNNPMTFAGLNSSLNRDSNFYAGFLSPGFLIRELEEINRRLANLEAGSILKRIEEVEKALKNFNRRSLPTLASRDSPRREDDDLAESVGGRGTPPPHPSSLASSDQGSRGDGSVAPRQTKKNTWEAQENSHGADLAANADLEVEDAATTLEFFALGRDRRRVIGEVVEEEHSGQKVHSSGSSRDDDDHDPPLPYESLSSSSSSVAAVRGTKPPRGSSGTYVRERCSSSSSASKGNEDPPKNLLKQAPKKPIPPSIPAALLDMDSVISILEIARDDGAWQHCCVHFPTFDRELAAMLRLEGDDRWTKVDPAWYSLFFVLQSISIHQMTSREAESCGITSSQAHAELPGKLLHAALDCLHHADYLVRPSMYACQAIGILCVCGHNVAGSDLLNSLLAVGIKTAQTLNLHGLGKVSKQLANLASSRSAREAEANKDDHNQDLGWRRRIVEVELGKRVWWALTQQDYFAIPFRGVYSVFAGQYDTPFPSNCHDEDLEKGLLIERPIHVLTVSTKQKFTSQMAKLICDFFEELNRKKICPTYDLVEKYEQNLIELLSRLPDFLVQGLDAQRRKRSGESRISSSDRATGQGGKIPTYAIVLKLYLFISVHHKILVLNRAFLARGGTKSEREKAHQKSIDTARALLVELEKGFRDSYSGGHISAHGGALWTIPYHAVAAATVLALDMFRPSTMGLHSLNATSPDQGGSSSAASPSHQSQDVRGDEQARASRARVRQEEVRSAMVSLGRFTKKSAIARRGVRLLGDLLEEGLKWDRRTGRREGEGMLEGEERRGSDPSSRSSSTGKRRAEDQNGVGRVMKRIRLPESDAGEDVVEEGLSNSARFASTYGQQGKGGDKTWSNASKSTGSGSTKARGDGGGGTVRIQNQIKGRIDSSDLEDRSRYNYVHGGGGNSLRAPLQPSFSPFNADQLDPLNQSTSAFPGTRSMAEEVLSHLQGSYLGEASSSSSSSSSALTVESQHHEEESLNELFSTHHHPVPHYSSIHQTIATIQGLEQATFPTSSTDVDGLLLPVDASTRSQVDRSKRNDDARADGTDPQHLGHPRPQRQTQTAYHHPSSTTPNETNPKASESLVIRTEPPFDSSPDVGRGGLVSQNERREEPSTQSSNSEAFAGPLSGLPFHSLQQILPTLESMPDVWRLFDGSLGQSFEADQGPGFDMGL